MSRYLKGFFALTLLLSAGFLFSGQARAQDSATLTDAIGAIVAVEGTVTVAGQQAAADAPLRRGDVVETGENARALILLIDDSEITLGGNASFTVDEYLFDAEKPKANRARYSVLRGAFLYTSGLMTKLTRPDVKIQTAYASIGIRGTIVWGGPIDGAYGVLVQEGEVSVETMRGSTRVRPSQGTSIAAGAMPASPAVWDADKIGRAVATISFADAAAAATSLKERKDRQQAARQPALPPPTTTPGGRNP